MMSDKEKKTYTVVYQSPDLKDLVYPDVEDYDEFKQRCIKSNPKMKKGSWFVKLPNGKLFRI